MCSNCRGDYEDPEVLDTEDLEPCEPTELAEVHDENRELRWDWRKDIFICVGTEDDPGCGAELVIPELSESMRLSVASVDTPEQECEDSCQSHRIASQRSNANSFALYDVLKGNGVI